ncbi:hypothetical protein [Nioella ostreopsis]|uniref:hypothetical protein n=1 Tax=Nioella ostreopsis TaxID=2448479 RepID=UPI000FD74FD8|nr:hypothetical protein [Nioella ostreopsis]
MGEGTENRRVISFQEAVDFAYEALEEIEGLPNEVDRLAAMVLHFCDNRDDTSLLSVIRAAETQALSYDALSQAAGLILERGQVLPSPLAVWTGRRLADQVERPKIPARFKRGWPGENQERDLVIYDLVAAFRDFGLTATRNDENKTNGLSGCDAVAKAMSKRDLTPNTFRGVKAVYLRVKQEYAAGKRPGLGVSVTSKLVKDTIRK